MKTILSPARFAALLVTNHTHLRATVALSLVHEVQRLRLLTNHTHLRATVALSLVHEVQRLRLLTNHTHLRATVALSLVHEVQRLRHRNAEFSLILVFCAPPRAVACVRWAGHGIGRLYEGGVCSSSGSWGAMVRRAGSSPKLLDDPVVFLPRRFEVDVVVVPRLLVSCNSPSTRQASRTSPTGREGDREGVGARRQAHKALGAYDSTQKGTWGVSLVRWLVSQPLLPFRRVGFQTKRVRFATTAEERTYHTR
jgi:hypothetical protein